MNKPPAFQLYAADFYMDTNEWTVEEMGIYTRLLFSQWTNGDLPPEPSRLARIAGCGTKKFQIGWGTISIKFILNGNGRLQNKKMEKVRETQQKYRELQAEFGKKGAKERWKKYRVAHRVTQENPNGVSMALQSSSSVKEINCRAVLDYLNEKTGKHFSIKSKQTQRLISTRSGEGFNLEDFKRVIDTKVAKWKTDPKMRDFLRPQTLFGTKFESYLQEEKKTDWRE